MSSNQFNIVDVSNNFNKYIKKIFTIIGGSLIDNDGEYNLEYFRLVKNKAYTVMDELPLLFLENAGKLLYEHRDDIINKNIDGIFNLDVNKYENDVSNYENDELSNMKEITKLFNILKSVWYNYSPEEKNKIFKLLRFLLSEYSKFILIQTT